MSVFGCLMMKKYTANGMIYMPCSINTNIVIKKKLPACGIVCSNPQRAKRIIKRELSDSVLHCNSWGIVIYIGKYRGKKVFVGSVPMGAAGSGFAFFEMYVAGAKYIVRYGSNDRHINEQENVNSIIIVDEADNLYGLMRDSGATKCDFGKSIYASKILIESLTTTIKQTKHNLKIKKMICHNVEDYHAYNFPDFFKENKKTINKIINSLEKEQIKKEHCWDMETAALFWRAKQFKLHATTVLQSIPRHYGKSSVYNSVIGKQAKKMEPVFSKIILDSLVSIMK